MSNLPTAQVELTAEERALMLNDLSALTPQQRASLYVRVCESVGLNHLTQPFQYLQLNGKLVLYAARNCTDQLRKINSVSLQIIARERVNDLYAVTARATTADGRSDESIGAVVIGHLKGEAMANALMKAECVPIEYEILTREGFKSPLELRENELVASVNPETMETKWVPLISKSIFNDQVLEKYVNSAIEFEITDGHKWIVEKQNGNRELMEFNKINSGHKIMMSGNPMNEKGVVDLSPKQAAALGWIVTDGTIKKYKGKNYRASVCQSKELNFEHIDWALSDMSPTKSITDNRGKWMDQHWWYLSVEETQKLFALAGYESRDDLPRIAAQLSPESRQAMLNAMMRADGDKRNTFAKTDKRIIECVQVLMALEGKMTSMVRQRWMKKSTKPIHEVRQFSYNHINKQNLELVEKRTSTVWCPTTKFGTWICRTDKGQVFVTGNTKAKRRVTLSICGLSFLDESELDTVKDARPLPVETQMALPGATGLEKDQPPVKASPPPPIESISPQKVKESQTQAKSYLEALKDRVKAPPAESNDELADLSPGDYVVKFKSKSMQGLALREIPLADIENTLEWINQQAKRPLARSLIEFKEYAEAWIAEQTMDDGPPLDEYKFEPGLSDDQLPNFVPPSGPN